MEYALERDAERLEISLETPSALLIAIGDQLAAVMEGRRRAASVRGAGGRSGGGGHRVRGELRQIMNLETAIKAAQSGRLRSTGQARILGDGLAILNKHGVGLDVDVGPPRLPRVPPKKALTGSGQQNIFTGSSRPTWTVERDTIGDACVKCGATDDLAIDHIEPWSMRVLSCPTIQVCINGYHWECILAEVASTFSNDPKNLQILCKSCNSAKGGVKGTDGGHPRYLSDCPGEDDCDLARGSR